MKRYSVYRDIRREALIMGLPVPFFALQLVAVLLSLLLIIFAFSLWLILFLVPGNAVLYLGLLRYTRQTRKLHFFRVFPKHISNKPISPYDAKNNQSKPLSPARSSGG